MSRASYPGDRALVTSLNHRTDDVIKHSHQLHEVGAGIIPFYPQAGQG